MRVELGGVLSVNRYPARRAALGRAVLAATALLLAGCGTDAPGPVDPAGDPGSRVPPPFSGTIFVEPDIIRDLDSTTVSSVEPMGRGIRSMYDRRPDRRVELDAWLFRASFRGGGVTEIQVNPEFDSLTAATLAEDYAVAMGRMPRVLSLGVDTLVVHDGRYPWGGARGTVIIHALQGLEYAALGIVEETLVHEAVHAALDRDHRDAPGWLDAQASDPTFISTYARDNPTREDLAETFPMWIAYRFRRDRMPEAVLELIGAAIPGRIQYLDAQGFDMTPLADAP